MDTLDILKYISPSDLDYSEWLAVGMALKHEGYTAADWDTWSRNDSRYHSGECFSKWESFGGSAEPVTAGTIVQLAKEHGLAFNGREFTAFGWDDEISYEEGYAPSAESEGVKIPEPADFDPVSQITTFLELLFEPDEYVGYVTEVYEHEKDGKTLLSPTRGSYDRTAGQLLDELSKCGGDIGAVFGDANPEAGAWIRINPLDGKGVKDVNVSDYRYVLIESDSLPVERQNALVRELELPVVTLTHTGGKSLHAVVRVDAKDREEYRKRVAFIFDVCRKNGLDIDKSCKNPSRLSRFPGFMRGEHKQFLVDTNIGKASFEEWKDYIDEISDDLPDSESAADFWDNMPELAPPLIDGVLRQGHKMLIAGPSKAGKSFGLIELAIAIAEGTNWLGFNCSQGKVWYINLELDSASCKHRFKDVYTALGIEPKNLRNIDIWNLRGRSIPMDKLAQPLIRRAKKSGYTAIIIDPIYKVITGDENSADQMAHFCNQFDKVCSEVGCAVIYCHHHSKGAQGGKKSMDRASGSGVFARDPDALLDLTELEITDTLTKQQQDRAFCKVCENWLRRFLPSLDEKASQDDLVTPTAIRDIAQKSLPDKSFKLMMQEAEAAKQSLSARTAWRIEGTLREFPKFRPLNVWFDYPVHRPDTEGVLQDAEYENDVDPRKRASKARKRQAEKQRLNTAEQFINAYNELYIDEPPTMQEIATLLTKPINTVRDWAKRAGYKVDRNTGKVVSNDENK